MKKLSLVALTLSFCAFSQASEVFVCNTKEGKVVVTVGRGSHVNDEVRHVFTYNDGDKEHRNETPEVSRTPFGKVVSMFLHAMPDVRATYASLVIPAMNLDNSKHLEFTTVFVVTDKMMTVGGPAFVHGLVDHSRYETVKCTGSIAH